MPRFNANGSFAGYIGSAIDVTERKLAEVALSTASQRLIAAQEEERSWIARELHDDIGQRLALLALHLDYSEHPPVAAEQLKRKIDEATKLACGTRKTIFRRCRTVSTRQSSSASGSQRLLLACATRFPSRKAWRLVSNQSASQRTCQPGPRFAYSGFCKKPYRMRSSTVGHDISKCRSSAGGIRSICRCAIRGLVSMPRRL